MLSPGTHLDIEWTSSQEGNEAFSSILHQNTHKHKTFGLLEKPVLPSGDSVENVCYKIFLVGKGGIGKTSTIAKLTGNDIPQSHYETPGLQTTTGYWPGRIRQLNKLVIFQLQFWDAGETAIKKFDHILPACIDKVDGIFFLFSFVDRGSFEDIPQQIARLTNPEDNSAKLVIGTKFDQHAQSEITQRDIRDFERQWQIPILKIANVQDQVQTGTRDPLVDVRRILNVICEHLWHRDIILAGKCESKSQQAEKPVMYL